MSISRKIYIVRAYAEIYARYNCVGGVHMSSVDYKAFTAERIANLRIAKGVSAREMSIYMEQSENYINHIENRKSEPSLQGLYNICNYFEITPQEFFDSENQLPAELQDFIANVKRLDKEALLHLSAFIREINKMLPKRK
jgi:transcriptional regulator with XRE-family HTH domain